MAYFLFFMGLLCILISGLSIPIFVHMEVWIFIGLILVCVAAMKAMEK